MPSEESEAQRLKQKFGAGTAQTRIFDEWDEGGSQLPGRWGASNSRALERQC